MKPEERSANITVQEIAIAARDLGLSLRQTIANAIDTLPRDVAIDVAISATSGVLASLWCARVLRSGVPAEEVPDKAARQLRESPWQRMIQEVQPAVARTIGKL